MWSSLSEQDLRWDGQHDMWPITCVEAPEALNAVKNERCGFTSLQTTDQKRFILMESVLQLILKYSNRFFYIKISGIPNSFYHATLCVSAVFAGARYMSICSSVCPSVTLVYCIQTAEDIVKLLSRSGSPIILVF